MAKVVCTANVTIWEAPESADISQTFYSICWDMRLQVFSTRPNRVEWLNAGYPLSQSGTARNRLGAPLVLREMGYICDRTP